MTWKPNVTVAAVVERKGRFLMVEERSGTDVVYNQPAGHLESGETLSAAAVRETLEETGLRLRPEALVGVYRMRRAVTDTTYLRVCLAGSCHPDQRAGPLDPDIIRVLWLSAEELAAASQRLRSPMVLRCIEDYLAGRRYPLDVLTDLGDF